MTRFPLGNTCGYRGRSDAGACACAKKASQFGGLEAPIQTAFDGRTDDERLASHSLGLILSSRHMNRTTVFDMSLSKAVLTCVSTSCTSLHSTCLNTFSPKQSTTYLSPHGAINKLQKRRRKCHKELQGTSVEPSGMFKEPPCFEHMFKFSCTSCRLKHVKTVKTTV